MRPAIAALAVALATATDAPAERPTSPPAVQVRIDRSSLDRVMSWLRVVDARCGLRCRLASQLDQAASEIGVGRLISCLSLKKFALSDRVADLFGCSVFPHEHAPSALSLFASV